MTLEGYLNRKFPGKPDENNVFLSMQNEKVNHKENYPLIQILLLRNTIIIVN